jgi:RimJ/RimL family protein N-acetyltransferase
MNIELRFPRLTDAALLLSWRNEPLVRKHSRDQTIIAEDVHSKWLENRISSLHLAPFYIVHLGTLPLGYVRFDPVTENEYDISYLVDPTFRGKGFGSKILLEGIKEFRLTFPNSILNAWVSNVNLASQKAFESLGFDLVEFEAIFRKYQKLSK